MTAARDGLFSPALPRVAHPAGSAYRADVDGLRAVAILLVVAFHAFPHAMLGGFIGVDIFFVISGFLITALIVGGLERNRFSFAEFYARRIRRIFPALLLVLSACLAAGWVVLFADEYAQLGKHAAGGAGFVSNLVLWHESGYFDNAAETKPLLHLWSLGVEEQFYILWPALLWLGWKRGIPPLALCLVVAAASFAMNVAQTANDPSYAFYSPQTRFWELQVGAMLAAATRRPGALAVLDTLRLTPGIRALAGCALILAGLVSISRISEFPGWWALLPTLGAALVISAGSGAWLNRVVLASRPMVFLGLISYPLYLWHWPLLSFAHILAGGEPSLGIAWAAVCASIALAWLTYALLEKPIRFGAHGRASAFRLAGLMLAAGLAGYAAYGSGGVKSRQVVQEAERVQSQFAQGVVWKYANNGTCLARYPLKEAADYAWWFCMESKPARPTLMLLGNSYANHLYPGLAQNPAFAHHSILSIGDCDPAWGDGYAPLPREIRVDPFTGGHPQHQRQLIDGIVEHSGSVRFAIVNGLQVDRERDIAASDITAAYIAALRKRIDFLERNNIRVIVFVPQVTAGYSVRSCFARPFARANAPCDFSRERYDRVMDRFRPVMQALSATNPRVLFFDQNELFCDAVKCSMARNGMPLFRDPYNHLSEYGSMELAALFAKWAKANVPELLR